MTHTGLPTAQEPAKNYITHIYFAKVNGGLMINTDGYNGDEQYAYLKRVYGITDVDLETTLCGKMSDGLIQFYSGQSKKPADLSVLTPREMSTILNTHNAFFKHNRFKIYNGITDSIPVHL